MEMYSMQADANKKKEVFGHVFFFIWRPMQIFEIIQPVFSWKIYYTAKTIRNIFDMPYLLNRAVARILIVPKPTGIGMCRALHIEFVWVL